MTPERMARLVGRWVRLYTRNLPAPIAGRRIDEIDADLHDHIAHDRARGTGERRIALAIAGRMIRGLPADASWRSSTPKETTVSRSSYRSVVRVALVTGLILLLPLVTTLTTDGEGWSVGDFIFAAVLLAVTGALLELAAKRPGNIGVRIGAVAIAVAAIVFGEADDAPGLVGFGLLLIAGTLALTVRTALRNE